MESEVECLLFGIVTPLKSYRLCWFINQIFDLELKKIDDLVITLHDKRKQLHFSRFRYEEQITMSAFFILENKHDGEFLLPDIKKADFILFIKGTYYQAHRQAFMQKLKLINEIQVVLPVEPKTLKSKSKIGLFDDDKG
ncbi:MAG: IPExxxVDY family protein [Chitinophagales bacterium]|nr:IPExxxVDY family protein [Chitinophagales bacterium]